MSIEEFWSEMYLYFSCGQNLKIESDRNLIVIIYSVANCI